MWATWMVYEVWAWSVWSVCSSIDRSQFHSTNFSNPTSRMLNFLPVESKSFHYEFVFSRKAPSRSLQLSKHEPKTFERNEIMGSTTPTILMGIRFENNIKGSVVNHLCGCTYRHTHIYLRYSPTSTSGYRYKQKQMDSNPIRKRQCGAITEQQENGSCCCPVIGSFWDIKIIIEKQ